MRDLLGLPPGADRAACRRAIAILGAEAAPSLALLNPVLPVELPETDVNRALTGAGRADRTRDLMTRLMLEVLPARAVLLVDDAHWLDSATWQLLDSVTRASAVSLVLVTRPLSPDDQPSEARRFLDEGWVDTIHLGPLPEAEAGALAAQALGAAEAARPLARFLHDKAAGHPLFTTALALTLAARGIVRVEAGAVGERIAALSPAGQLTLKTTSVLGRSFDVEAVAELHPSADIDRVRADLRSIAGTGLVERVGAGDWRFHHAIVADAAYASLTRVQVRQLHARAAARIPTRRLWSCWRITPNAPRTRPFTAT